MELKDGHFPVVIIGAGPSGLMMAAQLIRFGIKPLIIDQQSGPTKYSKALAVQARSLEIYRQLGLINQVSEKCLKVNGVNFHKHGHVSLHLSLQNLGNGQSPFPYLGILEQSNNEKILLDYLTQNMCLVHWETPLTAVEQDKNHVNISLSSGGKEIKLSTDWLIGADGSHSKTRKLLQIDFKGETYPQQFYLADLTLDEQRIDQESVHLFVGSQSFTACFPMKRSNTFRFVGNLPETLSNRSDLKFEEIKPYLTFSTAVPLAIKEIKWFATYRLHHRMAERFQLNRCFLIGDAAHVHSPVGGQGMNTGLQDAYNLAWKLAAVMNNKIKPSILDSYSYERMPVARKLLNTTDRIFSILIAKKLHLKIFRKYLLTSFIALLFNNKDIRKRIFKTISQTGIGYRDSKISLHLSQSAAIKAGDRLPYLEVWDEKKQEKADLHLWCNRPGFVLLILGFMTEKELFRLAQWLNKSFPEQIQLFYLPHSEKNDHIFERFELKKDHLKMVLIRPDMHIAFMSESTDLSLLANYLENVLGMNRSVTDDQFIRE